ncbi:tRNA 2-selenouridine(34) synthase MnmH [Motiliproteus sp. SC1-56]|uniref:tRNA 2-selenouridine(34) synthase MnmH n=1 Tax=Motiliproteus sp. SC1-56 TaxID=2799565 RepID=UPI001A8F7FE5|nr:tRNA 2-selenouridine(34) synthase MnmH [Motiliproteus sp. SC1-56]
MGRSNTRDYRRLFLEDVPLFDTRAPVEFQQGAFPNSVNLPLMSDEERAQVGTCYKEQGQEAAIELGHRLVCGELKEQRVAGWKAFAAAHPEGFLYCFRGGLRSRVTQQWLREAGIDYPYVEGGYKALRRYLLEVLEEAAAWPLLILGGRTGTGKTKVIERVAAAVDLEGLANHRGSSFGRRVSPQPTQIDFENALAIRLLKLRESMPGTLMLEDESRLIGSLSLPLSLFDRMKAAPLALLEEPMEVRIDTVIEDYVVDLGEEYRRVYGEAGEVRYATYMQESLDRIRKRLGGARHQEVSALLQQALQRQQATGELEGHRAWIEFLLKNYYDPMYDYQLQKKLDRVVFRGDREAVIDWFSDYRQRG